MLRSSGREAGDHGALRKEVLLPPADLPDEEAASDFLEMKARMKKLEEVPGQTELRLGLVGIHFRSGAVCSRCPGRFQECCGGMGRLSLCLGPPRPSQTPVTTTPLALKTLKRARHLTVRKAMNTFLQIGTSRLPDLDS